MTIRLLPDHLANRIAAGEVVERPASAVKELVENALDAGAHRIEIAIRGGGRDLIEVADDGSGMSAEELALAVQRHATSKLPGDDLLDIRSLGFRGEALPSIASVSRLTITTRREGDDAATLTVDNGRSGEVRPAARGRGTRIEVEGLFRIFPARLKFLKSDRAESDAVIEVVRRLAATRADVDFELTADGRHHRFPAHGTGADALRARLGDVIGRDFSENSAPIDQAREGFRLHGRVGIPTFNRATASHQLMIVNGRPVRDRLLLGALRGAYQDLMPRDRHPVVALYFEVDPQEVDVNVHPAKSEVRFRDAGHARALMISAIRAALSGGTPRSATTGADFAIAAFRQEPSAAAPARAPAYTYRPGAYRPSPSPYRGFAEAQAEFVIERSADLRAGEDRAADAGETPSHPLGVARAQIHDTYILAQNDDGVVLVDMHAAHERIVLERLKRSRAAGTVASQVLLVPEIVDLGATEIDRVLAAAGELAGFGLAVEAFGPGAVIVRETPAALGDFDVAGLVRDLADALGEWGAALPLNERLDRLASTFACHHSIRAGRRLKPEEMNALLRQIEEEPLAAQCNHGRPTYVTLARADLERLFHRR